MARKYFVRNYLKGFRRDRDPSGEIHRRNALGISSGRTPRARIDVERSLRPSIVREEERPLERPPEVQTIPLVETSEPGLNPGTIDAAALERADVEEGVQGLPGVGLANGVIETPGAPPEPASLAQERSNIVFTAKKRIHMRF